MIVSLSAACALACMIGPPQERPAEVFGTMFLKYYEAESVSGTMVARIFEGDRLVSTVETEVAFIRNPARIFIEQIKTNHADPSAPKESFLVIGDGKHLSYNVPVGTIMYEERRGERLMEEILPGISTVETQYALVSSSLTDRAAPLDIAFARTEDLEAYKSLWFELAYQQRPDAPAGAKVIGGRLRPYEEAPPSGTWQMVLSSDLEILRYETSEMFYVDGQMITLRVVYDVDFRINQTIPMSKFTQRGGARLQDGDS